MGKLEKSSRIKTRNTKLNRAILTVLAITAAGVLNGPALVTGVLNEFKSGKQKRVPRRNAVYVARGRLARQGLLKFDGEFWQITDAGKRTFQILTGGKYILRRPKKWDKKWRILIFDISEPKKWLRDKIRLTLSNIGFERLQDSVWVYPYDCEDLVALLKADFKIGKDLLYVIADEIENDYKLREHFQLPT